MSNAKQVGLSFFLSQIKPRTPEEQISDNEKLRARGRALNVEDKTEVINRLLAVWKDYPELRFGQLLSAFDLKGPDLFYVEDLNLVKAAEDWAKKNSK